MDANEKKLAKRIAELEQENNKLNILLLKTTNERIAELEQQNDELREQILSLHAMLTDAQAE